MARIDLDRLAHAYRPGATRREDFALKELTLSWQDGGAYALLGPSGCGKTTLLNIISGLVHPSQGRIVFDGQDVTDRSTEARNIAQVFQFPVIYDTMTVRQNLGFPLKNRKVPGPEIDRAVKDLAEVLGLAPKLDQRAQGLTADEKQKISLGRGLIRRDVNAILFDEPLTVIDPALKWELRSLLKDLHRRFAFTMIYVTHDQTEALTFADRVVVMSDGEVVQQGTPEELFDRPAHTFVGYFIGSPGMNLLPAVLEGDAVVVAGQRLPLARPPAVAPGPVELGIRPEFVRLVPGGQGMAVRVKAVEDVGRYRILRAELAGRDLNVLLREDEPVPEGAGVVFDPARVNLYRDSHRIGD